MPYARTTVVFVSPEDVIAEVEGPKPEPTPAPEPALRDYAQMWRTALGDECPHTATPREVGLDDRRWDCRNDDTE